MAALPAAFFLPGAEHTLHFLPPEQNYTLSIQRMQKPFILRYVTGVARNVTGVLISRFLAVFSHLFAVTNQSINVTGVLAIGRAAVVLLQCLRTKTKI
jgi:hypothetical protein